MNGPFNAVSVLFTPMNGVLVIRGRVKRLRWGPASHSWAQKTARLRKTTDLPAFCSGGRGIERTVSTNVNIGELLNLVGLSTGVVLYAMLLAMVVRAARPPGGASPFDPLLLLDGGPRSRLESVRAAGVRAAEGRHRRSRCRFWPRSASARSDFCRPSSSIRCCGARKTMCAERSNTRAGDRRVRRQRRRRAPASGGDGEWNGRPVAARDATADVHVRRARRAARRRDARPAGRAARALGGRARDVRGLGAPPEPASPGRRVVAGRARGPSRVAAAGASRSSIRTIPFALADLFLKRALALLALVTHRLRRHRDVRRAVGGIRAIRRARSAPGRHPRHALGGDGAAVSRAAST